MNTQNLVGTHAAAEPSEALGPIHVWPSGVRIQEQRNRHCSLFMLMECPDCGATDEPNPTDGDAYECRCCGAVHPFPATQNTPKL